MTETRRHALKKLGGLAVTAAVGGTRKCACPGFHNLGKCKHVQPEWDARLRRDMSGEEYVRIYALVQAKVKELGLSKRSEYTLEALVAALPEDEFKKLVDMSGVDYLKDTMRKLRT